MSSPGHGVVSFTIDPACILVSPARWFDKCQNYMKSLLGRQIPPQAGSSTSVFPFPRTTFLEEFQFLGDNCFNSLSQSEEEQVSVFSVSLPLPGQLQTERVQVHTSYYDWNNTGGCGTGRAITVLAKCTCQGLDLLLAQERHQNQTATSKGSQSVSAVVSLLLPFKGHLVLILYLFESWRDSGMEERGLEPLPVDNQ